MEITCLQMDVLLSFYIEGDLSENLKQKVQEHIKECPVCKAKYNIIASLFSDISKTSGNNNKSEVYSTNVHESAQYKFFKNNLSAYIDNELPEEENIKMRKYTINNKKARNDIEETYRIRKLMQDSFRKSKNEAKPDFAKNILKNLDSEEKSEFSFNPMITVAFSFVMSVILITAIVVYFLSLS